MTCTRVRYWLTLSTSARCLASRWAPGCACGACCFGCCCGCCCCCCCCSSPPPPPRNGGSHSFSCCSGLLLCACWPLCAAPGAPVLGSGAGGGSGTACWPLCAGATGRLAALGIEPGGCGDCAAAIDAATNCPAIAIATNAPWRLPVM